MSHNKVSNTPQYQQMQRIIYVKCPFVQKCVFFRLFSAVKIHNDYARSYPRNDRIKAMEQSISNLIFRTVIARQIQREENNTHCYPCKSLLFSVTSAKSEQYCGYRQDKRTVRHRRQQHQSQYGQHFQKLVQLAVQHRQNDKTYQKSEHYVQLKISHCQDIWYLRYQRKNEQTLSIISS